MPFGALHFGSLFAALGSYLHARACRGQWRVHRPATGSPRLHSYPAVPVTPLWPELCRAGSSISRSGMRRIWARWIRCTGAASVITAIAPAAVSKALAVSTTNIAAIDILAPQVRLSGCSKPRQCFIFTINGVAESRPARRCRRRVLSSAAGRVCSPII